MVWEGKMVIWNWYGAKFYQIFNFGKCVGRKFEATVLRQNYGNKVPIHIP